MKVGPSKHSEGGTIKWSHYELTGETSIQVIAEWGGLEYVATVSLERWPATPNQVWLKLADAHEGVPEAFVEAGVVTLTQHVAIDDFNNRYAVLAELTPEGLAELALHYAEHPDAYADREALRAAAAEKQD